MTTHDTPEAGTRIYAVLQPARATRTLLVRARSAKEAVALAWDGVGQSIDFSVDWTGKGTASRCDPEPAP
jgi:hypothetical protein